MNFLLQISSILTAPVKKDYFLIDSFVVYICTDGEFNIHWEGNSEKVCKGETVLLPAMIKEVILEPAGNARLLEVFINSDNYIITNNKPDLMKILCAPIIFMLMLLLYPGCKGKDGSGKNREAEMIQFCSRYRLYRNKTVYER